MKHTSFTGTVAHGAGLFRIQAERLVAEHGIAVLYRLHHMIVLHERRRMDRNEIHVRGQRAFDCHWVTRRDDVNLEPQLPVDRRHCVLSEPSPYDRYSHRSPLLSYPLVLA